MQAAYHLQAFVGTDTYPEGETYDPGPHPETPVSRHAGSRIQWHTQIQLARV